MEVILTGTARAYTVIENAPLQDARLSLKARGLLAFCLSLPGNWRYSVAGLVKAVGSDGRDAVRAALRELEAGGYLSRRGLRSARGEFARAEYALSGTARRRTTEAPLAEEPPTEEPPTEEPPTEKPPTEEPPTEDPSAGFPPQQSKYIKNKNQTTTTTDADADARAAEPVLSARLRSLAAACGVSEGLLARAARQFGAAETARYLSHMAGRQDIRNGGGWLMRGLADAGAG